MDLSLYSAMGKNDKYYTAYSSSISTVTSLNPNETLSKVRSEMHQRISGFGCYWKCTLK